MYTDVVTLLLKVVFHHPFMNELNQFNQVGLVALNCMGEVASTPMQSIAHQTINDEVLEQSFSPLLGLQPSRPQASFLQPASSAALKLGEYINGLLQKKQQAVASENYDQAQQLKATILKAQNAA